MQLGRDPAASTKRLLAARSGTLNAFVDREVEMRRRLQSAILGGQSLMVCGPPGIGKTALVLKVLGDLPKVLAAQCLYLPGMKGFSGPLTTARPPALRDEES